MRDAVSRLLQACIPSGPLLPVLSAGSFSTGYTSLLSLSCLLCETYPESHPWKCQWMSMLWTLWDEVGFFKNFLLTSLSQILGPLWSSCGFSSSSSFLSRCPDATIYLIGRMKGNPEWVEFCRILVWLGLSDRDERVGGEGLLRGSQCYSSLGDGLQTTFNEPALWDNLSLYIFLYLGWACMHTLYWCEPRVIQF